MDYTCKTCKESKNREAFPTRYWKSTKGEAKEGPRKVCYDCQRVVDAARYNAPDSRKRIRQAVWRKENAERINCYGRAYYASNRDKWLNPATGWRFNEKSRERDVAYEARPEVREAAKARGKAWRAANKARLVVKTRKRQAHVAHATPIWADPAAILVFYEQAEQLTKETGERHEVDHVIPLQGKSVWFACRYQSPRYHCYCKPCKGPQI